MDKTHRTALIELHAATLILALASICAVALREWPAGVIIFWRSCIGAAGLALWVLFRKQSFKMQSRRDAVMMVVIGAILAAHWVLYFEAIHVSTVAVAMFALFTFPVMTAFIEPVFYREKFQWRSIINAVIVCAGVGFLAGQFKLGSDQILGVLAGLASALLFATRNVMNRQFVSRYPSGVMMTWQAGTVAAVLIVYPFAYEWRLEGTDIYYLLFLALVCTGAGHMLFIACLTHLSVTTASIINCLQPVYGTIVAWLWWPTEQAPTIWTGIGGTLILAAVVHEAIYHHRSKAMVLD